MNKVAILSAVVLAGAVTLRAQQPPAAPPRPLVPMTASTVLRDPVSHMGENVSMYGAVEAILTKTTFTLDQDPKKASDKVVLVVAPTLQTAPVLNSYVTVQGELIAFDPAEVTKRARTYTLDLSPELVTSFKGRPAVMATVVISPALVDLAKRVPPPMTPEELAFRQLMTTISPASMAIRDLTDAPDAVVTKERVAALKKSFTDVEAYFKSKGVNDAATIAGEAIKVSTTMEQLAATGKWAELKGTYATLNQSCAACHGRFRERLDDGSFRIKIGG